MSVYARISDALFGSPSPARANGAADASLVPYGARGRAWRKVRSATPVYALDRRGADAGERLARVWISEPVVDASTGDAVGRAFIASYPSGPDAGGWRALSLAERMMGEARSCDDADCRSECFRAAEILLLHASARKNVEAYALLAWIYENDACAGRYWAFDLDRRARHVAPVDLAALAARWRAKAAARGHAESCCTVAFALARPDARPTDQMRARLLFLRAYGSACESLDAAFADAGAAALGLAYCSENGFGCDQSFEDALFWYEEAWRYLDRALDEGSWRSKRDWARARCGMARMRQEIEGGR